MKATSTDFIKIWNENEGSPQKVAEIIDVGIRNVYRRRNRLEQLGYVLPTGTPSYANSSAYKQRENISIENGSAIIVSDRHKWPGDGVTPAEQALRTIIPVIKPNIFIFNGDLFDGAGLSKHPPLGWEQKPTVKEEIDACQEVLEGIESLLPESTVLLRTVGNHDRRYDYHLAKVAPTYADLPGMRLSDHFPKWKESWSVHINPGISGGHTVVKHKQRSGVAAARTNAVIAGVSIVTGHTHALTCSAVEDYNGRRWGIECGFLAYNGHPAFEYCEDGPSQSRAGYVILTWRDSILQPPELIELDDAGVAWFRGEPISTQKPRIRVKAKSE